MKALFDVQPAAVLQLKAVFRILAVVVLRTEAVFYTLPAAVLCTKSGVFCTLLLWCWAFISIFFSLHPLISIKQLSATTAERIGVVY
jgi:hypothetical protein